MKAFFIYESSLWSMGWRMNKVQNHPILIKVLPNDQNYLNILRLMIKILDGQKNRRAKKRVGLDIKKELCWNIEWQWHHVLWGSNKNWAKKAAFGVKLFYYNLSPQPCSFFLGVVPFLIWHKSWVENILNLFLVLDGVNCDLEKVWKKHRKNCECCPVSQLIVR